MVIGIFKELFFKNIEDEINVDGHYVSIKPCISGMHQLFEQAVDSSKICDCLIPKFYQLIKHDPTKMQKFKELGFFTLEGSLNDSATLLLQNCIIQNLLDTNYKIRLHKFNREEILKKFQNQIDLMPELKNIYSDSFIGCVFDNLDGKITIKEYFAEDYMKVDIIRNTIIKCATQKKY